ncbi:hypothetical protein CI102_9472 [Trichoderma harzianum]|nr:hypothetical protein CI102_9472 [Trichoderma harzianum]
MNWPWPCFVALKSIIVVLRCATLTRCLGVFSVVQLIPFNIMKISALIKISALVKIFALTKIFSLPKRVPTANEYFALQHYFASWNERFCQEAAIHTTNACDC